MTREEQEQFIKDNIDLHLSLYNDCEIEIFAEELQAIISENMEG